MLIEQLPAYIEKQEAKKKAKEENQAQATQLELFADI